MWSFLVVDECKKPKIAFLGNRKEKGENDSIFKAEIHSSKTNVVQEQNDWFMNLWFYCLKRTFLCSIQSIVKLYWLLCFLRKTTFWNANAPQKSLAEPESLMIATVNGFHIWGFYNQVLRIIIWVFSSSTLSVLSFSSGVEKLRSSEIEFLVARTCTALLLGTSLVLK